VWHSILLIKSRLKVQVISQEAIVVQVGIRNRGKLNRPEPDKNAIFFLDDGSNVAKVAEQIINLSYFHIFLVGKS